MIFEVLPAHIESLSDSDLRTLVGYLAEREVADTGQSVSAVTYGGHQNARDGGIDVRVALSAGAVGGYLPRRATGFQAKAEDFTPADIKKEMCPKGKLRDSIRSLGETNGAYIIVSSKSSVSDTSLQNRQKAMMEAFENEPTAQGLFIDFYDKQRIASWVNQHPGIIPWVRSRVGQSINGWQSFQDWSSSPETTETEYALDGGVRLTCAQQNDSGLSAEQGIERLRAILAAPRGVVRLVGLSGVGKTRLVQALFDNRIGTTALERHLAVYTDLADNPDPVPAELLNRLQISGKRCIFIVDNCGNDLHRKLVSRLTFESLASLITVEYDISDDAPENTDVFRLEPASKEIIQKILTPRYPDLTEPELRTISDFSEGNFRIALALANTSTSGQSLANLNDKELFNRLFRQKNDDNPALLRAAKVCSLVYSFDIDTMDGAGKELPLLAALTELSVSDLYGHVAELQRRQLIQARSRWRALLPHALAHRLAKLALEDIPPAKIKAFIDAAPERLLKSVSRRLGCLHDHPKARIIVTDWLSSGGILSEVGKLTPLGLVILNNIAPVHPEAILESIKQAPVTQSSFFIDNKNADGLIRLLRSLAFDPLLFSKAVELIAGFARVNTESNNINDGVNVFKSLFYILLSGTHAPAKMRCDFLRDLANQGTTENYELTITGLDALLECSHFSSSYGFEFGTRRRDYGLRLATWDENFNWYTEAFSLANDLGNLPALRIRVRIMIASQFAFLARRVRLDDLICLAEKFAADGGWPEGWVGVRGALREAKEAKLDENITKLALLESRLAPASLADRIASYVLPSQWGRLDLADLEIDDDNKFEKAQRYIDGVCAQIGSQLADDLEVLQQFLPALLESTSQRVFIVGKSIGRSVSSPSQAWDIIERSVLTPDRKEKVYSLPAGFLAGLAERNRGSANALIGKAIIDPDWHKSLPYIQSCVGFDTIGTERLIATIPLASLPVWTLQQLSSGRATDELNSGDFKALMLAVADKEGGLAIALDIIHMRLYALWSDERDISNGEREIAREFLHRVMFEKKIHNESYRLKEIVRLTLQIPVDIELARTLCQRLFDSIREFRVSPYDYGDFVAELARIFPRMVLEEALEPSVTAIDGRELFSNFREHRPCPLSTIDDDEMLTWAHESPTTRFVALAGVIRAWQGTKTKEDAVATQDDDAVIGLTWTTTAIRLIHEAPDPLPVLEELSKGFRPSGGTGSLADIYAGRELLLQQLTCDANQRIADWAQTAIPKLRAEVQMIRSWEAGMDRERDERFEW